MIIILQLLEIFGAGTACVVCPVERIHYMGGDIHIPTEESEDALYKKLYKELNDIFVCKLLVNLL